MNAPAALEAIPVRALNQVTYCPRLYYLEYVEALMQINEHVEDGSFQHRRVTDEKLAARTRKEGEAFHTRSVSLTSEALGITATLDVVEEKGGEAYPVEYKRGHGTRDETGQPAAWENDAVQLCAQAMLLEESLGAPVGKGVLSYLGSRERIEISLDDVIRERTREAIRLAQHLSTCDTPPEPLPRELHHRCHGCSLVSICQPEETLFLLEKKALPEGDLPGGITRVIPQSDSGAVFYVQEQGARVGKRSEHLIVTKDGVELQRTPLALVRQVVIFGNVQVSTQALATLASNDIPVMYLTTYGRFVGTYQSAPAKNISLRQDQFRRFIKSDEALSLSREVVRAKLSNQRTLLMRSLRSRGEADERGGDEPAARALAELIRRVDPVDSIESLLGLEGQGASLYFAEFPRFLKAQPPGKGFDFRSRNRRPPRDPVNALLSFAYALLAKDCFSALCTVGFDPYHGFYHGTGRHGRPSLALDLMEEFRAVIADSVVLTLINNRVVEPADFVTWRDTCQLTEAGRKKFFCAYEQRKATVVKHPLFGYRMNYSRMLEVQARLLAAYVRGDIPSYTGFVVR